MSRCVRCSFAGPVSAMCVCVLSNGLLCVACVCGVWSTMTQGPRRCGARKERRAGPSRLKDLQSREVDREQCVGSTVIRCLWYLRLRGKRRPRWLLKLYSFGNSEIGQKIYIQNQSASFYSAWDLGRVARTFLAEVPVSASCSSVSEVGERARRETARSAPVCASPTRIYEITEQARWQTRNAQPLSLVLERPHGPIVLFLSLWQKNAKTVSAPTRVTEFSQ